MSNLFSLEGKTVFVTGASSGIGFETSVRCAEMGASLVITGRDEKRLSETAKEIKQRNNNSPIKILCDLCNFNSIEELVGQLPKLNGVVLNAGVHKMLPIKFVSLCDIQEMLNINTISQILLLKELIKQKKICDSASIVFTSSMAGLGETGVGNSLYSVSKSAMIAFSKTAALELASKKVRVNTVCPGTTNTPMTHSWEDLTTNKNANLNRYPLGRYGEPDDIANAIIFLLSDASSWITGIDLIIDGGMHLKR